MSKKQIYFETGCTLLDLVLGGDKNKFGIPAGKFINIVGDKSAGKSFLCTEIIAKNHYKYGEKFVWRYDDCESGYTFDTDTIYGFDIMKNKIHSDTVEEAFINISDFCDTVKKDEFGIYVLDSLDALSSIEQDERANERIKAFHKGKTFDKGTYNMSKQKYLSQEFFPQLASKIEEKNILVIIVSQVRENIDLFSFEKFVRSGGKAMDFYAYTVLWLATAKKSIKNKRSVGVTVKAKVTKSKTPRPFRDCFFTFLYDYGIDDVGSNLDFLFDLRTEKGELNSNAKAINYNENAKINKRVLIHWLKGQNLYEEFKAINETTDFASVKEFCEKNNALDLFNERFGKTQDRENLIYQIEDTETQDVLRNRVINKWEEIEDSIKTNRKKKYGIVPKTVNDD